jgi:hypothetical protein
VSVTSAVRGYSILLGHFVIFREFPRKSKISAASGKFRGSARNSAARGKLWALSVGPEVKYLDYAYLSAIWRVAPSRPIHQTAIMTSMQSSDTWAYTFTLPYLTLPYPHSIYPFNQSNKIAAVHQCNYVFSNYVISTTVETLPTLLEVYTLFKAIPK